MTGSAGVGCGAFRRLPIARLGRQGRWDCAPSVLSNAHLTADPIWRVARAMAWRALMVLAVMAVLGPLPHLRRRPVQAPPLPSACMLADHMPLGMCTRPHARVRAGHVQMAGAPMPAAPADGATVFSVGGDLDRHPRARPNLLQLVLAAGLPVVGAEHVPAAQAADPPAASHGAGESSRARGNAGWVMVGWVVGMSALGACWAVRSACPYPRLQLPRPSAAAGPGARQAGGCALYAYTHGPADCMCRQLQLHSPSCQWVRFRCKCMMPVHGVHGLVAAAGARS